MKLVFLILFVFYNFGFASTQQCLENTRGMKVMLKGSLNRLVDENSQKLDDLNWDQFCPCFSEVLKSAPKSNQAQSKELVKESDLKMQSCVVKAGFRSPKAQIKKSALAPSVFFEEKIKFCGTNGVARTIMIESELKVSNDPRVSQVRSLNLPKYCQCYFDQLRLGLGDESAKLVANFDNHKADVNQMLVMGDVERKSTETCVGLQIPYPKSNQTTASSSNSKALTFQQLYSSKFEIGKGLGPIVIGLPIKSLHELMGPSGVKTPRPEFDEYRYGSSLTELKVRTSPPGDNGKVIYVSVNYLFNGPISHGIKKGELFESVIEKMKPWIPFSKDRHIGHLMFKEGAQFSFADYNKGTLEGLTAFEPSTHPLLKKKDK